ncbi:MAG: hypothetical protein ACP5PV_09850 [Methanothrix sp.]
MQKIVRTETRPIESPEQMDETATRHMDVHMLINPIELKCVLDVFPGSNMLVSYNEPFLILSNEEGGDASWSAKIRTSYVSNTENALDGIEWSIQFDEFKRLLRDTLPTTKGRLDLTDHNATLTAVFESDGEAGISLTIPARWSHIGLGALFG